LLKLSIYNKSNEKVLVILIVILIGEQQLEHKVVLFLPFEMLASLSANIHV
jgi:hypothetical protein